MKIGILTFHWATNYGAVLQAYCLQSYLESQGHLVKIINFKPKQYDFSWLKYLAHPRSMLPCLMQDVKQQKKDKQIDSFRKKYLNESRRLTSIDEVQSLTADYDVLISGSDQILNPGFALTGDSGPCSVYFLTFASKHQIKVGYSVSFGCEKYPEGDALKYGKSWIKSFDKIGVRELSGKNILSQLEYGGPVLLTPDPVLLYGREKLNDLELSVSRKQEKYIYSYLLHNQKINYHENDYGLRIVDETKELNRTVESWISNIQNAEYVVTNSYHGTIVAILFHRPFVVVLANDRLRGMNDRLVTLLNRVGLENRMASVDSSFISVLQAPIDWDVVDAKIEDFKRVGKDFLRF